MKLTIGNQTIEIKGDISDVLIDGKPIVQQQPRLILPEERQTPAPESVVETTSTTPTSGVPFSVKALYRLPRSIDKSKGKTVVWSDSTHGLARCEFEGETWMLFWVGYPGRGAKAGKLQLGIKPLIQDGSRMNRRRRNAEWVELADIRVIG